MVGSDWGAVAAWHLSLLRPDRVRAMVALCVPFSPRFPNIKPLTSLKQMFGDDIYISQFQVLIFIFIFSNKIVLVVF